MFQAKAVFSGFSVNDIEKAKTFYTEILTLSVRDDGIGARLQLPGGGSVFFYPKDNHKPATFTILNFEVENIDQAVDSLIEKGVAFEQYQGMPQDEKGIMRGKEHSMGPNIAWFKDPAGNILSVIETG